MQFPTQSEGTGIASVEQCDITHLYCHHSTGGGIASVKQCDITHLYRHHSNGGGIASVKQCDITHLYHHCSTVQWPLHHTSVSPLQHCTVTASHTVAKQGSNGEYRFVHYINHILTMSKLNRSKKYSYPCACHEGIWDGGGWVLRLLKPHWSNVEFLSVLARPMSSLNQHVISSVFPKLWPLLNFED
jgi:hypothetical protein